MPSKASHYTHEINKYACSAYTRRVFVYVAWTLISFPSEQVKYYASHVGCLSALLAWSTTVRVTVCGLWWMETIIDPFQRKHWTYPGTTRITTGKKERQAAVTTKHSHELDRLSKSSLHALCIRASLSVRKWGQHSIYIKRCECRNVQELIFPSLFDMWKYAHVLVCILSFAPTKLLKLLKSLSTLSLSYVHAYGEKFFKTTF